MSFQLLKKRKANEYYNIVSLSPKTTGGGRFLLDKDNETNFWLIFDSECKSNMSNYYAECPLEQSVFKLDVDISIIKQQDLFEDKTVDKIFDLCYDESQVTSLIRIVNCLFVELFEVPKEFLYCFLLEKDGKINYFSGDSIIYKKNKKINVEIETKNISRIKRGFHLHWPLFCLRTKNVQKYFLTKIIEKVENENIFKNMDKCPIDKNSYDIPWLFYGCKKPDIVVGNEILKNEPYSISKAFDYNVEHIPIEQLFGKINLVDPTDDSRFLDNDIPIARKMLLKSYGRRCFDITVSINDGFVLKPLDSNVFEEETVKISNESEIWELINLLDGERCKDYKKWINVGRVLYNIYNGNIVGLETFRKWSSEYPEKYSPESCNSKWFSFKKDKYGIHMLEYWAKQDNFLGYSEYKSKLYSKNILNMPNKISFDSLADLSNLILHNRIKFCATLNNFFIFGKIKDDETGEDYKKIWKKAEPVEVNILLSNVYKHVKKIYDNCKEKDKKEIFEKFEYIFSKFTNPNSKTCIANMLKEKCCESNFASKLDTNVFLVAFENGIYDFNNCEFRSGVAEDYISMYMPCNYEESFTEDSPEVKEIHNHMIKFFTNQVLRDYMYDLICQIFIGNVYVGKKIFFFIGPSGNNGKTVFSRWIQMILGHNFFVTLPTSVLTKDKGRANEANPHLARIGNKKVVVFTEPENDEQINSGILKMMTGNDSIEVRDLFQKGNSIRGTPCIGLIFFFSNFAPIFKHTDSATFNRILQIEWTSEFVRDNAPATFEEQIHEKKFPAIINFEQEMVKLKNAFVWVLVNHWKKNKDRLKNLTTPDIINQTTEKYKKQLNILNSFIFSNLIYKQGETIDFESFKQKFLSFLENKKIGTFGWVEDYKIKKELTALSIEVNSENKILNFYYKNGQ